MQVAGAPLRGVPIPDARDTLRLLYGWTVPEGHAGPACSPAAGGPGFVVPAPLWERMQAFGLTMSPSECCAVGIGPIGELREFIPLEKAHEMPVTRCGISVADQLRIHQRCEERGWDVVLVFRTHPASEPEPSPTDRALAGWPGAVYAILGLGEAAPRLRSWRIATGEVVELIAADPGE